LTGASLIYIILFNRVMNEMHRYRFKIFIEGTVQGVGFRPTVYRYARERGLSGWVSNTSSGVVIEVEGEEAKTRDFIETLKSSPPPQAIISGFTVTPMNINNETDFVILPSSRGKAKTRVSPDIATCPDCKRELSDKKDRRFHYPFINCTNCGPRFTIVKNIPYDRDKTTMHPFQMCPDCLKEYTDPQTRRFHAQPNACGVCGPQMSLVKDHLENIIAEKSEAIRKSIELLENGEILAIKGLGGFHLACDATNDHAVIRLRKKKVRYDKPFALMAKNIEAIKNTARFQNRNKRS